MPSPADHTGRAKIPKKRWAETPAYYTIKGERDDHTSCNALTPVTSWGEAGLKFRTALQKNV